MNMKGTWCEKGFTLLELLLTMAILALIVGIMGSVLRLAVQAWEQGEDHIEEFRRTRIVMDLMAQQVKSFLPYFVKEEDAYHIAFEGESQSLKFVSPQSTRHYLITGLKWVHYYIEDTGDNGKALLVQEKTVTGPDFLEEEKEESPAEEPGALLLSGLVNLTFEYYVFPEEEESDEEEPEGEWLEAWSWRPDEENEEQEKRTLRAIKITIEQRSREEDDESATITTAMTIPLVAAPAYQIGGGSSSFQPLAEAEGPLGGRSGIPPPGGIGGSGHDELPF